MKIYYLLIVAGAEVNASSTFYKVRVGSSERERRYFSSVYETAVSKGYFFERYSYDVSVFLDKLIQSIFGDIDVSRYSQIVQNCSIQDVWQKIRTCQA